MLADLGNDGDGGADGNILGECGGVLPLFKLVVLVVDDFLLNVLKNVFFFSRFIFPTALSKCRKYVSFLIQI